MCYRPPDWDKIIGKKFPDAYRDREETMAMGDFEDGADAMLEGLRETINVLLDEGEGDTIEDGFGSVWSAYCPICGFKTMSVVRPGKCQCAICG